VEVVRRGLNARVVSVTSIAISPRSVVLRLVYNIYEK